MTLQYIVNNKWNTFIAHICEFHPLTTDFIACYTKELDWVSLSRNKNLAWSSELILQFEERWSWFDLFQNTAIDWVSAGSFMIEEHIDWFLLALHCREYREDRIITSPGACRLSGILTVPATIKLMLRNIPFQHFENRKTEYRQRLYNFLTMSNRKPNSYTYYEEVILPYLGKTDVQEILFNRIAGNREDIMLYKLMNEQKHLYYIKKMNRIKKITIDFYPDQLHNDSFSLKEQELKVIFPQRIKDLITTKRLKIYDYTLLETDRFYMDNSMSHRFPQTYKSVVIAENDLNDTVNLILCEESDYILGDQLYEFQHAIQQIEKIIW
ncbi:MAG TPA: hypothetical protein VIN08_15030 [Ohtaekwangia sp.]|uniref:hypothetical protein n=1 Tax=Ohtaekwangia sp. TaxID=2066019 RepID=UPI002F954969